MSFLIREIHLAPSTENKTHHCELSGCWNKWNILKAARKEERSYQEFGWHRLPSRNSGSQGTITSKCWGVNEFWPRNYGVWGWATGIEGIKICASRSRRPSKLWNDVLHQNEGRSKERPTQNGAPDGTSPKKKGKKLINIWMGSTILPGVLYSAREFGAG